MAARKRSTHVLPEPSWKEYKEYTDESEREKAFQACEYFVHYEIDEKRGIAPLKKWMKENWTAEEFAHVNKLPDSKLIMFAKYGFIWSKLGYMTQAVTDFFNRKKNELIEQSKTIVAEKQEAPAKVASIARDNLDQFVIAADDSMDIIRRGGKVNVEALIANHKLNAGELSAAYTEIDNLALEFRELEIARKSEDGDQDLIEGYSHIKKPMLSKILAYFNDIQVGLMETKQSKKIVRIKRKKPTDKTKLVRKLRFLESDATLNIKSVNPVDIIGASEVWVYDVKRKRLGVYASEYVNTLGVKGTAIDNYAVGKSYEKTLRKPEEQLAAFMETRKNGLHKFTDSIRGKSMPAKTRLNANTVILRIVS